MSGTRLFLIRHAVAEQSPDVAEADWPLSSHGHAQAQALAGDLPGEAIHQVWASPYLRAVDTVAPLANRFGQDVKQHSGLRERKWSEAWLDDFEPHLARSFREPDFKLQGGESAREALHRFDAALIEIASAATGERIVVGTHGNVLSLFLRSLDPSVDFQFWQELGHATVFAVDWDDGFRWQRQEGF